MTFLLTVTAYQPVHGAANPFTAKPVRTGDNLISLLRQHGFTQKERKKILTLNPGIRKLFLTLDTNYLVRNFRNGKELRIFDSQSSRAIYIYKKGNSITAYAYKPKFRTVPIFVHGKIRGSFLGSVLAKINSNRVASRFMDAYAFDLKNENSLRRGARFWFSVEKNYEHGQFIKYGEVLQTSLEINGSKVQKKFIASKDGGVFFSTQNLFENRPFYAPVGYLKIASRFNLKRVHPITGKTQAHLGVDFELPTGQAVYSPRKGIVIRYGHNHAAGNYIVLLHSNGMETSFNHLYRLEKKIRPGLKVAAGEKIAEVGCTGYCTRAHLHFSIKNRGQMVDPLKYLKPYPSHMEQLLEKRFASN